MQEILTKKNARFQNPYTLADLLNFMSIPSDGIDPFDLESCQMPEEKDDRKNIEAKLHTSPKKYFISKTLYLEKLKSGEYKNLLDYFKQYNLVDVEILLQAWLSLAKMFHQMFSQNLLMSWSLPGLAQKILLCKYNPESPPIYTFPDEFGFLNEKVRDNICGGFSGPISLRHVELDNSEEKYDKSVYYGKNGQKFTQIRQDDANALYPTVMREDMPTGIGFYLRKDANGKFSPEMLGTVNYPKYSQESLEYLDMIQGRGHIFIYLFMFIL